MKWGDIPPHLISERLPLKPTEMSGRYSYRRVEDTRCNTLAIDEFFFFEFHPGYHLETFYELSVSLGALRYLSSIMYALDLFKVVLTKDGIYVKLRARINDSYKPAFAMNY